MVCACKNRAKTKYLWTSADGTETVEYDSLIVAKAKVQRKGGSYAPIPK
jgi:hypothetical protein